MRYLVTGAAGFIGSHVVDHLLADGHEVIGFDDMSNGNLANLDSAASKCFELVIGDIRDLDLLKSLMGGVDGISHQAALGSVPRSIDNPRETADVNIMGTMNVLEAARTVGARVVAASSSSVFGGREGAFRPLSPYAASKAAVEALLAGHHKAFDVVTFGLRYYNVYGPRQSTESAYAAVVPKFIGWALRDKPRCIYGDGLQTRDFTFVEDVAKINVLALTQELKYPAGTTWDLGCGRQTSIKRLAAIVQKFTRTKAGVLYLDARPGDPAMSQADVNLIDKYGLLQDMVDLGDGMYRTVEWMRRVDNSIDRKY